MLNKRITPGDSSLERSRKLVKCIKSAKINKSLDFPHGQPKEQLFNTFFSPAFVMKLKGAAARSVCFPQGRLFVVVSLLQVSDETETAMGNHSDS